MKAKMKQKTDNRHEKTSRKVWEYTITGDTFFNCDKLKMLNAHGKDGWEAVCQIGNGNILMKRIAPNAKIEQSPVSGDGSQPKETNV